MSPLSLVRFGGRPAARGASNMLVSPLRAAWKNWGRFSWGKEEGEVECTWRA